MLNRSLFLFLLLFVFLVLPSHPAGVNAETLTVRGDKVNLRSGPGTAYSVKWEFSAGFPVKVLKKQGDWFQVIDFEEDFGWLHRSLLHNKPHVIVTANRESDGKVNIRSGPGVDHPVVAKAYYGVVFETLEKRTGWVNIRHETGLTGWILEGLVWGY